MALVRCPDCGKEVSTRASSCPNCGGPVAAEENKDKEIKVITEHTSKSLKGQSCLSGVLFLLGVLFIVVGIPERYRISGASLDRDAPDMLSMGFWMVLGSFVWHTVIRISI